MNGSRLRPLFRRAVQAAVFVLMVWEVYRFYRFVYYGAPKPDATDAFCPIVGTFDIIMKLKTGITDPFHPAAMAIILASVLTTLLVGKVFCSYVCVVGTFLDLLTGLRKRFINLKALSGLGKRLTSWRYYGLLDLLLRTPKFLIAGWFIYTMVRFPPQVMVAIAQTSNASADISLFKWWVELLKGEHPLAAAVMALILLFSLFIPRFWCRYLCPLGALYGVFNLFSLVRIRRDRCTCKGCGSCNGCFVGLKPSNMVEFNNTECTACLDCSGKCPTASIAPEVLGRRFSPLLHALLSVALFFGFIGLFIHLGLWHSQAPKHLLALFLYRNGFVTPWVKETLGPM
ncbi:4Fe-4S binding protein [Thermovibrio ammonificans]|uniref:4Fe-4S ferredoxin iron-sulfur binding domain protein n=1 Tax=Thermovibrio ammonificans (strain DSM 15698 / JCM 12110 / HB-1) TaxID=648996 RepID=E8T4F7_THEA1|nr:4Fe-4S binding protein [Thermovibrio ammonificans]ADU96292.1 4Fe-4S ferredoxin iron-sulfur binding domain protein [Thermovibrio ammonificans HB-1]